MVRINLLPSEIIERRRWERWYPRVFVGAGVIATIVIVLWLAMQFLVKEKSDTLQQTEETVESLNAEAAKLAIFEQQTQALQARQAVVSKALAGRVDMGRILEEVSLVLPDNVWLTSLTLSEEDGASFNGNTPETEDAESGEGYKSVAATLVRLNSLDSLRDVWLSVAESGDFQDYQGDDQGASATVVEFEITSKIVVPGSQTAQTAVPAPPTAAGQ